VDAYLARRVAAGGTTLHQLTGDNVGAPRNSHKNIKFSLTENICCCL
jgi:hypothetical protein